MKSKLIIHKSRSPVRYDFGHPVDALNTKLTPNVFLINKGKLGKNELGELFGKRARSNSPRKILMKNIQNMKLASKCRSPLARKNSPLEISRKANASQRTSKAAQSPGRIQNKLSPERLLRKNNPLNSNQPLESEELKALKFLAKRKHKLNKDLWEAAENGDIQKIGQLLNPYSTFNR